MILLVVVSCGFGVLCCLAVLGPLFLLLASVRRYFRDSNSGLRFIAYGYTMLCAVFGAYWCRLILETSWQLISVDNGPGPFGLLAFLFGWRLLSFQHCSMLEFFGL